MEVFSWNFFFFLIDVIRGIGFMLVFDLVMEWGGYEFDGVIVKKVIVSVLEKGLVVLGCGVSGEMIWFLYFFMILEDIFNEGFDLFEVVFVDVCVCGL